MRGVQERQRFRRRPHGAICIGDAMPSPRRAHVLAHELARLGIEEPDQEIGPLHLEALADPAGRRAIVRGLKGLEVKPAQRGFLRVPDPRFHFPFAIRITDATRQCDDAVVREHVAIERVERGIVDVGREHALAQIVEHDHADRAA